MAHVRLTDTNDYELEFKEQDIRGWPVRDSTGKRIDRVADMIVNTDEERVDAILLENGDTIPAADIHIGDDAVYLDAVVEGKSVRPVGVVYDDYGIVRRTGPRGQSQ